MAPASNEEQFKFLISCIRYSNNGKVDFGQVAKECKIVTKGAAAKRYERMMRSHGIAPNAASIKPAPGPSSTLNSNISAPTSAPRGKSTGKKRKFSNEDENADDEEDSSSGQGPSRNKVKREVKSEMSARNAIKEEMYREDSPSAQLREGMQMGLGAGLCDVNRELVDYYSGGSSAAGSVSGEGGEFEFGDGEGYASDMVAGGMSATGAGSGALNTYGQPQSGYSFNTGGYGGMMSGHGMMGSGTGMGGHGGQNMTASRSHAAGSNGMGMGAQQYRSIGQAYDSEGGSESSLLVE
ncbi:uncharacterized protein EAF02_008036 [Botrytis sinoallii]|uniref:uncharacterized protein n=1 Tax=Botrytis sinoallii TaxID=1463999 RepID=UPI0018FF1D71|nr:uncharacterized protein EAF02_008036 [Botrytis sinoallii]KAF7879866.1 hypothetical protein EAF02_008036 [Botrytis sinoallii]